ncbi:MAG: YhfC family intramembrane metalloprotease [Lachnospiraceae bacterium]|nr:YhfC family intramembrane metalloprotease [Lachnospiraceae bacterium]
MYEFEKISTGNIALMVLGATIFIVVPVLIWILWTVKKKEKFTTILIGAATFFVFVMVEKIIQNVLIFPTAMGFNEHEASIFINARPVLWAFLVGLFPGVFEETGRFVAFKTLLKKRRNRETSISYGIGHGGFEIIFILGLAYINYVTYALMINSGAFSATVEQVQAVAPEQVDSLLAIPAQLSAFSFVSLIINMYERIWAFLFHTGASIIVFYACKDKKKFWLYPLAIILHTAMDMIAGLSMSGVLTLSDWQLEAVVTVMGVLEFFGAYFLLYKKDVTDDVKTIEAES